MGIQIIAQSATASGLQSSGPVSVPVGSPVCQISGIDVTVPGLPDAETGLWECTPGRFRRQVETGEVMHILTGAGRFEPEAAGEPAIEFRAGDTLFFPAATRGVWEIRETVRKLYVMLGRATPPKSLP